MDNDLMARRLRPPSETSKPTNGQHPPATRPARPAEPALAGQPATDEASEAKSDPTWATDTAPWAPSPSERADVPWDQPAQEPASPFGEWEVPALSNQQPARVEQAAVTTPAGEAAPSVPTDAPWDRPTDDGDTKDMRADDGPAWDVPVADAELGSDDYMLDDRPVEMFSDYEDQVAPVAVAAPTPAPAAEAVSATPAGQEEWDPGSADPYDAHEPVLGDLDSAASHPWSSWSEPDDSRPDASADDGTRARPPIEFGDSLLRPTPPATLFAERDERRADAGEATPDAGEETPAARAQMAAPDTQAWTVPNYAGPGVNVPVTLPHGMLTAGNDGTPTNNLVLRIELAIIDEARRVKPLDAALRVGPTENQTPRDPRFEPRSAANPDVNTPPPATVPPATADAELRWGLPSLDPPLAPAPPDLLAQRAASAAPVAWAADAWVEPAQDPAPWVTSEPAQPVAQQPAAQSGAAFTPGSRLDPWAASPVVDPLAGLPAATFAPPSMPSASPSAFAPTPFAADQWQLATEPVPSGAASEAQADGRGSSILTAMLTIGMAVLVIVLVLVFIQLMTSLLR